MKLLRWWKARSRNGKIAVAVGAALVVVIIVAAAVPQDDGGGGTTVASAPVPPAPPSAPEPAPEPPATPPAPPAPPADTGRMSEGEYTQAKDAVVRVDEELTQFRERVAGRCAVILRGGQVAESLACGDEAYDGVEGGLGLSFSDLDDLRGDVDRQCRRALDAAAGQLNAPLFRAAQASKTALDSLDGALIEFAVQRLDATQVRWERLALAMLNRCRPA